MKSFAFYSFADPAQGVTLNGCSMASEERPLIVNCAGCFGTRTPFTTENAVGRHDHYLLYINSGELTFFNGNERLFAREGSVVVIPAERSYKYVYSAASDLGYYWVHFTGSEALSRLREYSLEFFPCIMSTNSQNRIAHRFQGIFDAFEQQDEYRDHELSALLERLLIAVARSVEKEGGQANLFSRSLGYMTSNYNDEIRIPALAAMEHLSTSRYNFLFKEKMGVSPKRYILQLRMSSAAELLAATDLRVKEVGSLCGYRDSHFFCKTFREYFGVSPSEYRQGKRK